MDGSQNSLTVISPALGASSSVLLTPGRTRNIAQDMEALRLSRQDNPYLQQVMASRESLIESHMSEECESDDTILMSQEFGSAALDFVEEDPLTLKEVHEHMIRSPPPISSWSHDAMSQRTSSVFDFSGDACFYSSNSVDGYQERSPRRAADAQARAARASRSVSPRRDPPGPRPLSLPGEVHLRTALSLSKAGECRALLPARRRRGEDSVRLVASDN